jgi:hypothetical protein
MGTDMTGKMKISHHYDKQADVLYVTFADNEPTYTEDVDGILMLDIGWFSRLPKGFRILGPKYHNIRSVNMNVIVKRVKKQVRNLMEQRRKAIEKQEPLLFNLCDKLPKMVTAVR